MNFRTAVAFLLISVSFIFISASTHDCSNINFVFENGETLKYKVYYNWRSVWIGAGEATMKLRETYLDDKQYLHSKVEAKTLRRYDLFYRVRDVYESYFDPSTLMSRKFIRNVDEGGYTIYNNYDSARDSNQVVCEFEDYKTELTNEIYDLKPCTHDVVSSIYYLRCYDISNFEVGDTVSLRVFIDNEHYNISIRYLGKEVIKTRLGKFRCLKVSPTLIAGRIFEEGKSMVIYVTDDDNRLPILVESPISVGSVKAMLIDYEGLRNPLSSKL